MIRETATSARPHPIATRILRIGVTSTEPLLNVEKGEMFIKIFVQRQFEQKNKKLF
jgi:hypothetical protein